MTDNSRDERERLSRWWAAERERIRQATAGAKVYRKERETVKPKSAEEHYDEARAEDERDRSICDPGYENCPQYRQTIRELQKKCDDHIRRWETEHAEAARWQQKAQELSRAVRLLLRLHANYGFHYAKQAPELDAFALRQVIRDLCVIAAEIPAPKVHETTENETEKPARGAATPEGWDWQPIETAPRDGTRVYLAYDTGPNSWDWNFAPCRYHSVGWYLSPNGEIGNPIHFNPTHWAAVQRTAASRSHE